MSNLRKKVQLILFFLEEEYSKTFFEEKCKSGILAKLHIVTSPSQLHLQKNSRFEPKYS